MATAIFYADSNGVGQSNTAFYIPQSVNVSPLSQSNGFITSAVITHSSRDFSGNYWKVDGSFNTSFSGTIANIEHGAAGLKKYAIYGLNLNISQLTGDSAAVSFSAFSGNDNIQGSTGGDTLLGYNGNDYITGAAPDSTSDQGDVILGGFGNDVIYGMDGDDSLVGGSALVDPLDGDDVIYGGNGNDEIYGSGGKDLIYGGNDRDLIVGGADNDILSGGAGNDTFVFVLGGAYDTVLDFAVGDIITIERTASIRGFSDIAANITADAYGSFISLGGSNGITFAAVDVSTLGAESFFFYG